MRLRLIIRRHALPDAAIIWDADGAEDLTIASLLEKVNYIVPLESEESNWGLEDYAVEVPGYSGSFECLHFQVVGRVFRDDDEVIIRPLLTQDSRRRRQSGRVQISADGMKLIDGIPFGKGKPLRDDRIRRPAVTIPPLKRRRITYEKGEEEEEEEEESHTNGADDEEVGERQLLLKADFGDEDEEDDEDFNPDEDDGEEGEDKDEDFNPTEEQNDGDMRLVSDEAEDDGHESDAESSVAEENPLFDYFDKHGLPKGSMTNGRALELMAGALERFSKQGATAGNRHKVSNKRNKKVIFEDSDNGNLEENLNDANLMGFGDEGDVEQDKADEESSSDDSDSDSESGSGGGSSSDGSSNEDGNTPKRPEADFSKDGDSSEDDSSSDESSDEENDAQEEHRADVSKPGDSSADDISNAYTASKSFTDSDSSSDSDSDSDSDAEPEEVSSKISTPGTGASLKTKSTMPQQIPFIQASKAPQKPVPPHQGTKSTKSRNERRRNTNALRRMQNRGIIPAGTTLEEFNRFGLSKAATIDEAQELLEAKTAGQPDEVVPSGPASEVKAKSAKAKAANAEFEARRKQLLESLASGGIEVGPEIPKGQSSRIVQKLADTEGDVEMGNTASPVVIENQSKKDTLKNVLTVEEAPTALLTEEQADKKLGSSTSTPQKLDPPYNLPIGKENCLKDMTFVFTGQLESVTRNQGRELVTKYGGKVVQNPSLKTNYVVLGSNVGESKLRKIENLKLNTISGEGLFELITKSVSALDGKSVGPGEEIPETPTGNITSTTEKQTSNAASATPTSDAQARRVKLDVGAGRRMLFGALGIKNPKTKADEERVRNNMMKTARPVKAVGEPAVQQMQQSDEDLDSWREKISLRGEECCHDGIELNEPPFPFIQRWDLQQQGSWPSAGRGGKRKRNQRDRSQYYDDEPSVKSNKSKRQKSWNYEDYDYSFNVDEEDQEYGNGDDMELNYDEQPQNQNNEGHNSTAMNAKTDTQITETDDLPILPQDLSTLSKLGAGEAKAGMVIAFKHLIMGPNYQPQFSHYRTAVVYSVLDSGDLQLALAKRDRKQKEYDPDTGERIFGQFEVPVDDDEDEEDDGALCLAYEDLVEPLIVSIFIVEGLKHPTSTNNAVEVLDGQDQTNLDGTEGIQDSNDMPPEGAREVPAKEQCSTDNSTTLDHEKAEHPAGKSGGTSLDQDSPLKSIEDSAEKNAAEKHAGILTEDLLQKSTEGPFLDISGKANEVEDPESNNTKDRTPLPVVNEEERMEVDAQIDETVTQISPRREDQSTPRPIDETAIDEAVPEVQVQETASGCESPKRNRNLITLNGRDGSSDIQIEDSFLGKPSTQRDEISTPRPSSHPKADNNAQSSPNSITESARHDVSIMMRNAGFRSDIPSSILRGHQLNVQNTPGDATVFEKLMREMAPDTDEMVYSSPLFKGFASSSPTKAPAEKDHLQMSPTPVSWENPSFESQVSNHTQIASQSFSVETNNITYPKLQDLSSYTSLGDHGRQPDLISHASNSFRAFDEFDSLVRRQDKESSLARAELEEEFPSAQLRNDSESVPHLPTFPESMLIDTPHDTPPSIPERQSPLRRSPSPKLPENHRVSLSFSKDAKKNKKKAVTPEPVSDSFPSSDSDMPTLQEVLSQQPRIKSEPQSQPSSQSKSKIDEDYEAAMAKHDAMYDSDLEDLAVPPASQNLPKGQKGRNRTRSFQKLAASKEEIRRASASQVPRMSQPPRPSSQASKLSQPPRPSMPPPPSQMIDLTLSSSDVELEPEQEFSTAPVEPEVYHTDEIDSDYQYSGPLGSGWASKKVTSVTTRGKSLEPSKSRRVTTGVDGGGGSDYRYERVSSTQDIQSTKWAVGGGKGRKGGGGGKEEGRRRRTVGGGQ